MKNLMLGLAFVLELVAFIAFADLGLLLPGPTAIRVVAFIILLLAIIVFWSLYMAPKAPKQFKPREYYIVKATIYAFSAVSIMAEQTIFLGSLFVTLALISERVLYKHNVSRT